METPFGIPLAHVIGTPALPFSRPFVTKLIRSGLLKASKIGSKYFIDAESLASLAARHTVKPEN